MSDPAPTPDQVPGAPHPQNTQRLIGQTSAENDFLSAFNRDRLHHAWLISGPRGTGKATLAYRLARFLLSTPPAGDDGLFGAHPPPETLDTSPDHPVSVRMDAGSEPGLRVITRSVNEKTDRLRDEIVVDDIRRLAEFFHLSIADGGRRVVIVDSADEMNTSAGNALLKMLEEPPAATTMLLLSHQPSRLLPTIRSRCRSLRVHPLGADHMAEALQAAGQSDAPSTALTELSGGSVGAALRLTNLSGLEIYAELIGLLATLPQLDRPRALALAEAAAQRGAEARLDLLIDLLETALTRLARQGATGQARPDAAPQEAEVFARLAPSATAARAWAETAASTLARVRHGRAVNIDTPALLLDTFIKLGHTAQDISRTVPA